MKQRRSRKPEKRRSSSKHPSSQRNRKSRRRRKSKPPNPSDQRLQKKQKPIPSLPPSNETWPRLCANPSNIPTILRLKNNLLLHPPPTIPTPILQSRDFSANSLRLSNPPSNLSIPLLPTSRLHSAPTQPSVKQPKRFSLSGTRPTMPSTIPIRRRLQRS